MKQFIRKWAEIFSNYKLLARIMICLSVFTGAVVILAFAAFQMSKGEYVAFGVPGLIDKETKTPIPDAHHQVMGMFCFLTFIATLVIVIVILSQSFKFAFPKDKMNPGKAMPILCVVNAGLCVVDTIFCLLAIFYDHSVIPVFWFVVMALFIVAALANAVMLLPVLRSHYYMPKFEANGEKK